MQNDDIVADLIGGQPAETVVSVETKTETAEELGFAAKYIRFGAVRPHNWGQTMGEKALFLTIKVPVTAQEHADISDGSKQAIAAVSGIDNYEEFSKIPHGIYLSNLIRNLLDGGELKKLRAYADQKPVDESQLSNARAELKASEETLAETVKLVSLPPFSTDGKPSVAFAATIAALEKTVKEKSLTVAELEVRRARRIEARRLREEEKAKKK